MHFGTLSLQSVSFAVKSTVQGKKLSTGPGSTTNSIEPMELLESIKSTVHSTQLRLESNLQSPLQEFTVGALWMPAPDAAQ